MTAEELKKILVQNNAPYIKIYDNNGALLMTHADDNNVHNTTALLETWLPVFTSYNRVKVHACNESMKKNNWTGCYKYEIVLVQPPATGSPGQQQQQFVGGTMVNQFKDMLMLMQLMGNINQPRYEAELTALRKEFEWQRKLDQATQNQNDPMKYIAPLAPVAMSVMGMKPEQIAATLNMSAMANNTINNRPAGISGTTLSTDAANVWSIEKAQALTNDEKNVEIQKLLTSLSNKISGEHFLVLLSILDNKPELSVKVIQFQQAGMI